ncbi:unnamed protein product [Adineta ricciae]|uniref:Uncharacterized protein n=1 Tax=Adineta ricciae TaxID=249248 RepID=A0A813X847_ADIRI|nr:unnamed protein product [Adineta ricciae]
METYPTRVYSRSDGNEPDNKENVVLRSIVGTSDRHVPLVEHRSPSSVSVLDAPSASMYTLGTRYQPIPQQYLPKKSDPKAYYIPSEPSDELPRINQKRDISPTYQAEKPYEEQIVFLEPQVISQPVLYSVAGEKYTPRSTQPVTITEQPPSPVLYSLNNRSRTVDMVSNSLERSTPVIDKTPIVYSWAGNSRLQNETSELSKQHLRATPNVYSITGSPARTSRGVQVSTPTPAQPTPILYTIVDDAPATVEKPRHTRPLSPPVRSKEPVVFTVDSEPNVRKQQPQPTSVSPKGAMMYTLDNEPNARKQQQQIIPAPPKDTAIYTLENGSNARRQNQQQQQEAMATPTLYALVGKPLSPLPQEIRSKPPVRKKTPPPAPVAVIPHRSSRSLERKPDVIIEDVATYPVTKTSRQTQPKETSIPKPELIIIPASEERRVRPQVPRQPPPPSHTNDETSPRKTTLIAQHSTNNTFDYQSPYTARTYKPYREVKYNTNNRTLPPITTTRPEKKERPPLYEPRYRVERHHPYVPLKPTTLDRYPVNTKPRSSLWDTGYQTQTDDDEDYEHRLNKKSRTYKTFRARAPWIPVW